MLSRGRTEDITLVPGFRLDMNLLNPRDPKKFMIREHLVPLKPEMRFPFAVISGNMYYIFWSENETQRANWLNALECLRVSFKAALEV